MRRLWVALTALCCLVPSLWGPAYAADLRNVLTDYVLTSWNAKEGLPPGTVTALAQDRDGYLWVGNDAGLFRFDGARFVAWNAQSGAGIPKLGVRSLLSAADGSLWVGFGGNGGVGRIRDGQLHAFSERDGFVPSTVSSLLEHGDTIWAGTTQGLYRFRNGRFELCRLGSGSPTTVYGAFVDANGTLFVGTSEGLFRGSVDGSALNRVESSEGLVRDVLADTGGTVWVTDAVTGFRHLHDKQMVAFGADRGRGTQLLQDRRGDMWLATGGQGLWRVQLPESGQAPTVERATSLTGLLGDGVYSLLEDRDGNIWAGTTEGLNRLTPRRISQIIDLGIVRGIDVTPESEIWIGTVDGLVRYDRLGTKLGDIQLKGEQLTAFHVDERGVLWVATDRAVKRLTNQRWSVVPVPASEGFDEVESISSDRHGGIWLSDAKRGLSHWSGTHFSRVQLPIDTDRIQITSTYTDRGGHVWAALSDGQVAKLSSDAQIQMFGVAHGLAAGVYDIFHEDDDGVLWLGGTLGISRYRDGRFETVVAGERFPISSVIAITSERPDSMWIGSNLGIVHIDRVEFDQALADPSYRPHFTVYDRSDGIAGVPILLGKSRRVVKLEDGRLWFLTARGVTIVNPRELEQARPPSPVRIEEVIADGRPMAPVSASVLGPRVRRLEIAYTVINMTSALKTRFRYRLEGFDTDWIDSDGRRQVFYTNLSPGSYAFRVAASNDVGGWAEPDARWDFSIAPMFYQRGWFYGACALVLAMSVALAWQVRAHKMRKQFALLIGERTRLSREIHDTLLQSLVGVALQCDALAGDSGSPTDVKREQLVSMRKQVEEYIREARQAIWDLRSPRLQEQDLTSVLRKTAEHAVEGHDIRLEFEGSTASPRALPRVEEQVLKIGQEAVLNAVHHARASAIRVELTCDESFLTLRVSDDGCGFNPTHVDDDHHYGLLSMKERAATVGGRLTVATNVQQGTAITAVIPVSGTV